MSDEILPIGVAEYARGKSLPWPERPEWNIRCCICGHTWMSSGRGPRSIDCAQCDWDSREAAHQRIVDGGVHLTTDEDIASI